MFKNKRVQILFTPRVPEPEPIVEEPVEALEEPHEEVVGISSAIVESQYKEFILGVVVDYNGIEYDFEWDARNFQLARLSGEKIHPATWQATSNYLTRFFTPRPAPKPVVKEPPVTVPVIEKIVEKVVAPIEEKIAPPKPVVVEEEELEASDDELAARARQVLQELGTNNLDLEYMEL